jgi:hypothetical protein
VFTTRLLNFGSRQRVEDGALHEQSTASSQRGSLAVDDGDNNRVFMSRGVCVAEVIGWDGCGQENCGCATPLIRRVPVTSTRLAKKSTQATPIHEFTIQTWQPRDDVPIYGPGSMT